MWSLRYLCGILAALAFVLAGATHDAPRRAEPALAVYLAGGGLPSDLCGGSKSDPRGCDACRLGKSAAPDGPGSALHPLTLFASAKHILPLKARHFPRRAYLRPEPRGPPREV